MKFLFLCLALAATVAKADRFDDIVQTMVDEHLRCFYATLPLWKSTVLAMARRDLGQITANFNAAREQRCNFITSTPDGFMPLLNFPADTDYEMLWAMVKLMKQDPIETLPLSFNSTEFHVAVFGHVLDAALQSSHMALLELNTMISNAVFRLRDQDEMFQKEVQKIESQIKEDMETKLKQQEDERDMIKWAFKMMKERKEDGENLRMPPRWMNSGSEPRTDPLPASEEYDWEAPIVEKSTSSLAMTHVEEKGEPCLGHGRCATKFWSVQDLMSQIEKGGSIETVVEEEQKTNGDVVARHVKHYLNFDGNRVLIHESQTKYVVFTKGSCNLDARGASSDHDETFT